MLGPGCGSDNPSDAEFCDTWGANQDATQAESLATPEESAILTSGSFVGSQQEMGELGAY